MSFEMPKTTTNGVPFTFPTQAANAMNALFARQGQMAADALATWQTHLREFTNARMKANLDLQSAMAATQNPVEIASLQRDWAVTTTQAYVDEGRKLTEMSVTMMRDGITAWADAVSPNGHTQAATGNGHKSGI
jgi:hypothetical protein